MTITPYNPGQYLVSSATRAEVEHLVDVVEMACSCEAALDFGTRGPNDPCSHLQAVLAMGSRKPAKRRTASVLALFKCKRTQ